MELKQHGHYRDGPAVYAAQVRRWSGCGQLVAAVSQDYMCEPFILAQTGLTTEAHQRLTIERYDAIRPLVGDAYLMPVLQGYWPEEYVQHLHDYGERLTPEMWVGVGSVCKRNVDVESIEQVLMAIRAERPDLRLHGFGVKLTALESSIVRRCLWSADSMAWSYSARSKAKPLLMALRRELGRKVLPKEARRIYAERGVKLPDGHDWREAKRFADRIDGQEIRQRQFQPLLF